MKRRIRRWAAFLALAMVLTALTALTAGAAGVSPDAYPTASLTLNGKSPGVPARLIEGRVFVPLHAFVDRLTDATYRYDAGTGYATLTAPGLVLTAGQGATFLTANDRCLYGVAMNRLLGGTMWVPLDPLAKACGLRSEGNAASGVRLRGTYSALTPASRFYREDAVYWLSRIISAESRGESLRGQIAVGNVVLNRVASEAFPDTIWGVIFDPGQFAPVKNRTVYDTPAWTSVCAAKMCLEGYDVAGGALYFCNVRTSTSHWVMQNRPYAFTLGNHSFYL